MKPLAVFILLIGWNTAMAQHIDYISLRKKNGKVLKNIYAGTPVVLQATDGTYLAGPVEAVKNDSLFVRVFDIRFYRTNFGSAIRDTVTSWLAGLNYRQIARVQLRRSSSGAGLGPSVLMAGGAGFFALNVINGALFSIPITDAKNVRSLGIASGTFLLGFLLKKFPRTDGFSRKHDQIIYVDLSTKPL